MDKGSPKPSLNFSLFFLKKCPSLQNFVTKQQVFPHCTPTYITDSSHQSMHHSVVVIKSQVFTHILRGLWCVLQRKLLAIENMAAQGMGNKKITEALGVPLSTTKRWQQRLRSEGEVVSHNVGRPRGEEARVCLVFLGAHLHFAEILNRATWPIVFSWPSRKKLKTQCDNVDPFSRKSVHFCNVHFSLSEKQILI